MNRVLNRLKTSVAVAALALLSVPAHAVIIGGTEVGSLDTLIGAIDSANSGQAYEEAQLELAIGGGADVALLSNVNSFTKVSSGGLNYIDVDPSTPGYYILKFGTGNTGNDMFFMKNEDLLRYLAWSDADLVAMGLPSNHVQSLSHYAITASGGSGGSGGTTGSGNVPEPNAGSLALLGLGLLAAGFGLRRKSTRG